MRATDKILNEVNQVMAKMREAHRRDDNTLFWALDARLGKLQKETEKALVRDANRTALELKRLRTKIRDLVTHIHEHL